MKPIALNCFKTCSSFFNSEKNGINYSVCAECALRIASLIDCPKENPLPPSVVIGGTRGGRSQSREAMLREIAKSKMLQAARNAPVEIMKKSEKESYQQKITRLNKEYGKKKRKK